MLSNCCNIDTNEEQSLSTLLQIPQEHLAQQHSQSVPFVMPGPDKPVQSVYEYKGKLQYLATTQQGSKYLQRVLTRASPDIVEFIIKEVIKDMSNLMVDQYGNYFCQKLLQSSSSQQRCEILSELSQSITDISCTKNGTHSMQSLIEMINMDEEYDILEKAISDSVFVLAWDPQGTHVLQKSIFCSKEEKLDYIFYPIISNLFEVSKDTQGLWVVKKIIARFESKEKRRYISSKIWENLIKIAQSQFGQYIIQQIFESWEEDDWLNIFEEVSKELNVLSLSKHSSCVVEKWKEKASPENFNKYFRDHYKKDKQN